MLAIWRLKLPVQYHTKLQLFSTTELQYLLVLGAFSLRTQNKRGPYFQPSICRKGAIYNLRQY